MSGGAGRLGDRFIISASPWMSGTSALRYMGPVECVTIVPWERGDIEAGFYAMLDDVRRKCEEIEANACMGSEVSLDPFNTTALGEPAVRMSVVGTATRLEPLW